MTDTIRALIVDDEPLARSTIRLLLEQDPDIEVIGECINGHEAVAAIRADAPDLVFLDVQMPEMNGFEALAALRRDELPVTIFVTAYDQYALRAFDVHALDYLLKPFDDERFADALERAKLHCRQSVVGDLSQRLIELLESHGANEGIIGSEESREEAKYLDRVVIRAGGRVYFLKAAEIDWIEAADYYVRLHVGQRYHLLRETMRELESKLDPSVFCRIHRSTIVNLERVRELRPGPRGESIVALQSGVELRMSRSRREHLRKILDPAL